LKEQSFFIDEYSNDMIKN